MTTLQQLTNGIEGSFPSEFQKILEGVDQILFDLIDHEQVELFGEVVDPGANPPGSKRVVAILEISPQELRALEVLNDEEISRFFLEKKFGKMAEAHHSFIQDMKDFI